MATPTDTSGTSLTPLEEQILLELSRLPKGRLASEATSFLLDIGILNPYERWYDSLEAFEDAVRRILVIDDGDETRRIQPHALVWAAALDRWSVTVRDARMIVPLLARLAGISLFFQRGFEELVPTLQTEPDDAGEEDRPDLPDLPPAA